jgi:hypothetical protein
MIEIRHNESSSKPWEVWESEKLIDSFEEEYYEYAVGTKEMWEQGNKMAMMIKKKRSVNNVAWEIKFKDSEHEEAFNNFMAKAKVQDYDKERTALFYTLALFDDTRKHINDLYDFEENWIELDGLHKGWQTGGTTKATKLAFNLYNNWHGEDGENEDYSPLELFSVSTEYRNYMLLAVQIRFS